MTNQGRAAILAAFSIQEQAVLAPSIMKKRFIAGVVCPRCAEQDSIMAFEDTEQKVLVRECVACGFTDKISTIVNQPKELQTRVTGEQPAADETVQVIKILK